MDATKCTTGIRVSEHGHSGTLVELFGEFDAHDLGTLRETLDDAPGSRPAAVNLSGVTFLDVRCARELADRSCLHGRLKLREPSWQARASFRACGLKARNDSCPGGEHYRTLMLAT